MKVSSFQDSGDLGSCRQPAPPQGGWPFLFPPLQPKTTKPKLLQHLQQGERPKPSLPYAPTKQQEQQAGEWKLHLAPDGPGPNPVLGQEMLGGEMNSAQKEA